MLLFIVIKDYWYFIVLFDIGEKAQASYCWFRKQVYVSH